MAQTNILTAALRRRTYTIVIAILAGLAVWLLGQAFIVTPNLPTNSSSSYWETGQLTKPIKVTRNGSLLVRVAFSMEQGVQGCHLTGEVGIPFMNFISPDKRFEDRPCTHDMALAFLEDMKDSKFIPEQFREAVAKIIDDLSVIIGF